MRAMTARCRGRGSLAKAAEEEAMMEDGWSGEGGGCLERRKEAAVQVNGDGGRKWVVIRQARFALRCACGLCVCNVL